MKMTSIVAVMAAGAIIGTVVLAFHVKNQNLALDALRRELESRTVEQATREQAFEVGSLATIAAAQHVFGHTAPPKTIDTEVDTEPPKEAEPPLSNPEIRQRMATVFAGDPVNQTWAQERAKTLTARLQVALSPASVLKNIECHSSICRFETAHDSRASFTKFMDGAFKSFDTKLTTGASVTMIQGRDADGRIDVVSYVAGEGEPLPSIGQM
jgi:hypothetical protein